MIDIFFLIFSIFLLILSFGILRSFKVKNPKMFSYSILIACRNEEQNLHFLFSALDKIEYPKNLFEVIKSRGIQLYPDPEMRVSISHTIAVQNPRGWRIAKEKTSHKIDVIVALGMAVLAAIEKANMPSGIDLIAFVEY